MPRGAKPNSNQPSREWLEQKYVVEGLTNKQIADLTGYSLGGISNLIWRLGLRVGGAGARQRFDISRDLLYQLHVVEGLTAVKIAARLGCHNSLISRKIKSFGLDPGRPLVNAKVSPPASRDTFWKLYWVDQLSLSQIGVKYGFRSSTAARWFIRLDIPRRRWNGGDGAYRTYVRSPDRTVRDQHEFSNTEREAIQKRDGYRCQMPGCAGTERLEANHILPIKFGGSHDLANGITLCHSCHASIYRREMDFKVLFDSIVQANSV